MIDLPGDKAKSMEDQCKGRAVAKRVQLHPAALTHDEKSASQAYVHVGIAAVAILHSVALSVDITQLVVLDERGIFPWSCASVFC